MMNNITINQLSSYLDTLLNSPNFPDSAVNGIQVTNTGSINKIVTAVSASIETIQKAIELKAQALIVHHGIFKKNEVNPIIEINYKKIKLLIENNIALLCYHLPLDAHRELGNNWKAAYDLGLQKLEPFCEYQGQYIGVIGTIPTIKFDEFKKTAEEYYGKMAHSINVKNSINKIAIVSGGADRFIKAAGKAGADCYITGRVDEPVWDDAHESDISFLGFGHYTTETVGPKALSHHIQKKFNLPCTFIKTDNPF